MDATPPDPETAAGLLAAFTERIRLADRDVAPGHVVEHVDGVLRTYPADPREPGAMIESPLGLGDHPDATIARHRDFFVERGQSVEWKTYTHDQPVDLGQRLSAAGFTRGEDEALMLGELERLVGPVDVPQGITVRVLEVDEPLERITALTDVVWGADTRWVAERLADERRRKPEEIEIVVAQEGDVGAFLCAGWVRFSPGTDFAGMWGGHTHPDHRRRGLYRATLARRATLALERGHRYARVDASPASEPILTALGLMRVGTTIPFVLEP
ncbi:hypothetical protein [Janibacter sp. G1551]|uniref:hypothetical protein n=1 Tax=Janibacter sp. G1551 TaxID=3420440 RepID=UPI003D0607F4